MTQERTLDQVNMDLLENDADKDADIQFLCEQCKKYNYIAPKDFTRHNIKRGLRNADGTGVLAGITKICNVHGYVLDEGEKSPVPGRLTYRGIDIRDIVAGCMEENRFGFEEVAWLLLFGHLPTAHQLEVFGRSLARERVLPDGFVDDVIIKLPSRNVMNTLGRAALALYCYDDNADDTSLENVLHQSIKLIANMPLLMVAAYQAKRRTFDRKSMYFHQSRPGMSTAENILRTLRSNKQFTDEEAKILDLCLMLHAEHGGGNNSTFAARVLTSSGTDTYSAVSAGIGSLKGPRHGGANAKVLEMMEDIKQGVHNWEDEDEVTAYLEKIMDRQAGDGSGLIYGMGHAVYTLSDPRAELLVANLEKLVLGTDHEPEYRLYRAVEKLSPDVFRRKKGLDSPICANVDMYSGMVYKALRIPEDLYTPLFAVSRTAGWCAHRIEEILTTSGKIIRPAYKAVSPRSPYLPLHARTNGVKAG